MTVSQIYTRVVHSLISMCDEVNPKKLHNNSLWEDGQPEFYRAGENHCVESHSHSQYYTS